MSMKITILGCGSSGGVPRVGGDWGACDPLEPKNRRRRCSIVIEYWEGEALPPQDERTITLVDTSPDLREQLLAADIRHIDAVLYTHDHGDQTHGIDDLRAIAYKNRTRIPVYMDKTTRDDLHTRFSYCFEKPDGRVHPPILETQKLISDGSHISVSGAGGTCQFEAFEVGHGSISAFGFKIGDKIAYTPDVKEITDAVLKRINGLDLWILDALRYHSHPTHAHADQSLSWAAITKTKKLILTNLHIDMDYKTANRELPGTQCLAHDGMIIHIDSNVTL
ncbi:MAG: MBL fold metallo-hydrolase [Robiginitomaculum sp.]